MFVSIIELLVVAGSWWLIFRTLYQAVVGRVEIYFRPDEVIIDDIYTAFSLVGVLSFLWLAPLILA